MSHLDGILEETEKKKYHTLHSPIHYTQNINTLYIVPPLTWFAAIKAKSNNILNSKRNKGNVICFRNYLVNDDA